LHLRDALLNQRIVTVVSTIFPDKTGILRLTRR
jgi:hypothetical protein